MTAPQRPDVDPHDGPPPADLVVEDITTGDGPEAVPGQTVTVHYVGVAHSSGEEFDASWNRGAPFRFALGAGQVIGGWDQGVTGMRVGGRRKLVLPPHLGYGDRGAGGYQAGRYAGLRGRPAGRELTACPRSRGHETAAGGPAGPSPRSSAVSCLRSASC